jgi:hypothetical protein
VVGVIINSSGFSSCKIVFYVLGGDFENGWRNPIDMLPTFFSHLENY